MSISDTLNGLSESKVIAVLRCGSFEATVGLAHALAAGRVSSIEVTLTGPGALDAIRQLSRQLAGVRVGAGTVLTADEANQVIDAGSSFLVSPGFSAAVHSVATRRGVAYIPGAFTPTEVQRLLDLGLTFIKIFPVGPVGPSYVRNLLGPYPSLRAVPTGGVGPLDVPAYLAAGAAAVGVGSAFGKGESADDLARATEQAAALMSSV